MKTIEVTISPKGQVSLETRGFAGNDCRQASAALEQALGLKSSEQLTAEFHTPQAQHETQSEPA